MKTFQAYALIYKVLQKFETMINTWIQPFVTFHEHTKKDSIRNLGDGSNIKFVTLTLQIYILHPSNYGSFFALFVVGIVTHLQGFALWWVLIPQSLQNKKDNNKMSLSFLWGGWWESNPRISEPQSEALTAWRHPPSLL